jgi:hypothetical protein
MFDRFTDRARMVVGLARQEAEKMGHGLICGEHLLIGLLGEGSGVGANALDNLLDDVDLDRMREKAAAVLGHVLTPDADGSEPFSPTVRGAFDGAAREAQELGHNHIGTEHLLLGLVREEPARDRGTLGDFMEALGLTSSAVAKEVMELIGEPPAMPYHERIKMIQEHQGCDWTRAQNLYSSFTCHGGENPFPPGFKVPDSWMSQYGGEPGPRGEDGHDDPPGGPPEGGDLASKRGGVPWRHLQMARWLVRKCGGIEPAVDALTHVAENFDFREEG